MPPSCRPPPSNPPGSREQKQPAADRQADISAPDLSRVSPAALLLGQRLDGETIAGDVDRCGRQRLRWFAVERWSKEYAA